MRTKHFLSATLALCFCAKVYAQMIDNEHAFIKENMEFAAKQCSLMLQTPSKGKAVMPHSLTRNGQQAKGSIYLWTAGFFPGTLWYVSEYTNNKDLRDSARVYTEKMEPVKTFTGNHDIGFMMYCSYGNANRFVPDSRYDDILIESARSLCSRFNATTGTIQSWNSFRSWHGDETYDFPVIIDNMMNLELLFFASRKTGDRKFKDMAVSHAEKTMKNQVRNDYSCYHVVYYDKNTGKAIKGETAQGYADNSTWARGQAWGIYGFTMVYRETQDPRFLKTAQRMADYYVNHPGLPADKITYWDFNANQNGYTPGIRSNANNVVTNYRDASAAATIASALLELSTYTKGKKGKAYLETARQILHSLGSPAYRAQEGANGNFILMHSVGSIPHNSEIDVPLTYADYYFTEALYRYDRLLNGQPLF
ncbi:MAG: glycoside hydrolase family 88 protein [Paraprevotella sp.]|nr:glycoside hydrolase family 88 protein [Paraprevotella sp.]